MRALTHRESQVAARVAAGMASKNIAHDLGICEGTVKVHLKHAYSKTGLDNRVKLAVWWRARSDNPQG